MNGVARKVFIMKMISDKRTNRDVGVRHVNNLRSSIISRVKRECKDPEKSESLECVRNNQ